MACDDVNLKARYLTLSQKISWKQDPVVDTLVLEIEDVKPSPEQERDEFWLASLVSIFNTTHYRVISGHLAPNTFSIGYRRSLRDFFKMRSVTDRTFGSFRKD